MSQVTSAGDPGLWIVSSIDLVLLETAVLTGLTLFLREFDATQERGRQILSDLAQESTLLRTLIDNLPDSVYAKDRLGRKTLANRADLQFMGVQTESEVLGKTDLEIFPEELATQLYADDQGVIQTGRPLINREECVTDTSRRQRWLLTSKLPLRDREGKIVGLVGIGRDITERKRAEEEIRRLNQALERRARGLAALNRAGQIMSSTLDLSALLERVIEQIKNLLDVEGASVLLRPLEADTADSELVFAGVTGAAAEKLINQRVPTRMGIAGWVMRETQPALVANAQNDPRFYPGIDAASGMTTRSILAVPLIFNSTTLGVVEAVNRTGGTFDQHDLEVLEALTSSAAIAIENARLFFMLNQEKGRLEFLYHLSQHLAESLDMSEVAQRALDGLHAVTGLLRGLVVVRESPTPAGISSGERDLLRPVAVSAYGAESVEALNQRLQLRVGDGLIGWVAAHRQLAVIDDVAQDPRWMLVPGLDEWVRSALSVPLLSGDDLVGVLNIYCERVAFFTEDIRRLVESAAAAVAIAITNARLFSTERQRVTELAHALEQQRELDRLQREFIQNVSHELRTPLALIRGHAEVLESGWMGELAPEQKESVGVIARRSLMLTRLVNDIIGVLEIEQRELIRAPVDLAPLVRAGLAEFRAAAENAGLVLTTEIVPELPPISGDAMALRRVLDNLVSNALKFTPAGGRVTVRLCPGADTLMLEVADTGIGIPADQLEHIFERFYQVDGSATRKYGGMGLGLALVKQVVEAHGGQITVTSEVEAGSTFTVVLPVIKA